jgi:hypothetical protein
MPEGGAYVWDAWLTNLTYNPNIVLFVKRQANYGTNEGGSGRPTVLDRPHHIALFDKKWRNYQPPYLRTLEIEPRLYPPKEFTPEYPQRLETVL